MNRLQEKNLRGKITALMHIKALRDIRLRSMWDITCGIK